ncbi:MAG: isoprenylcysteine carboxylmethyltransferase family protein [Anaerolineae bacterium]
MQIESQPERINWYGVNAIGKHLGQAVITGALLFLGAGTTAWSWGWAFAGATLAGWLGLSIALALGNPALLNQRGQPVRRATEGTKRWDLLLLALYTVLVLVQPFVAGLDRRFNGIEATVGAALIGNGLLLAGFGLLASAMVANRYFDPTVRIRAGQAGHIATRGPYRIVRHPGYTGVILQFIALPIGLGSGLALIPGLLGVGLLVLRTALEDRTLHAELPGYAAYARRTRYRLIPGLW